jgi:hypothetical protein
MLISIVVVAVAITGLVLTSNSAPQKIPALSAVISNVGRTVYIYHDGGDTLQSQDMYVLVNGQQQQFAKNNDPSWATWSTGESLAYTVPGTDPVNSVRIVYTSGGGATTLSSADFGPEGMPTTVPVTTGPVYPPSVTGIDPSTGVQGSVVSITDLAGTNFVSGAEVILNRTGYADIPATGVSVISATRITCSINLAGTATGVWNVVVENPDGQRGTLSNGFTVINPAPTVTSIAPASAARGTTVSITNLAGTGFLSGATVKLTQTGQTDIPGTSVVVVSPAQITCDFAIPSGAATGSWDVVVTNPDSQEGSLAGGFSIGSQPPAVSSVIPNTSYQTTPVSVTVNGANFLSGGNITLRKTGQTDIIGTSVVLISSAQATCQFNLVGAATGAWDVVATNADGQSGTLPSGFVVSVPAPQPSRALHPLPGTADGLPPSRTLPVPGLCQVRP